MPDTPTTQPEFACLPFIESDFPQIPVDLRFSQYRDPNGGLDAFFEEEKMIEEMFSAASQDYNNSKAFHSSLGGTFSDTLNGGYIELKNLIPSIEELDHHDSCLWELESQGNWNPSKL